MYLCSLHVQNLFGSGCPGLTNTQATSSPTPTKIYDIVDSCQSNPCHPSNSLNCTDGFSEYTCTCKTGFGGRNCGRVCPSGCDGYNCDSGESCITNPCKLNVECQLYVMIMSTVK